MRLMMKCIHWFLMPAIIAFILSSCTKDDWEGIGAGASVPAFSISSPDGSVISSESLKGKIYLLTFFNTTCPDCQEELPVIQQLYSSYRNDIVFLNISRSESHASVSDYWQKNAFTMPFIAQESRAVYNLFASSGIPRLYLVDGSGVVVESFDAGNMPSFERLSAIIDELLFNTGEYTSLTLRANVLPSRASADDDDVKYFYNEYAINKLYGFFYDAQTKKLSKTASLIQLSRIDDQAGTTYDISYLAKTIKLKSGRYDVFCVANTDNPPMDIENEEDFLNTIDATTYSEGIISYVPDAGAVMSSSASEYINLDFSDMAKKHSTLSIRMERAIAKVRIAKDKDRYDLYNDNHEKYADVSLTNYRFVNLNRSFYLFRHTAMVGDQPIAPDHYVTPDNFLFDNACTENTYVIDPHFFNKTPDADGYSFAAASYAYPLSAFVPVGMAPMPAVGNFGAAYLLENTMHRDSQKNGYTTGVIFKAAVNPLLVYIFDRQTGTNLKEYRIEYWPDKLYYYNYNFYGSLRALNVGAGLNMDELKTYTDAELEPYGIKQINFNMGVYETYYIYWIRHRTEASGLSPMHYGIVRNNFYNLHVADITKIGYSSIYAIPSKDNE